jgi:N-acetyl-anhydromuramyl-L-alanine amidase AmpD
MIKSKIIQCPLDKTQYYQEKYEKKQIVLHHTASNGNAKNVINGWKESPQRIGVAFVIDGEGLIHQAFSSTHWAHHLGVHAKNNRVLNQQSIGIEICNWGPLSFREGKYFNYLNQEIPGDQVVGYFQKFRGGFYYQRYSEKQLESLKDLLDYLCDTYKIPKTYNTDMWSISKSALLGKSGIYTHVSFRKDKSDCHPQKELIEILTTL